MFLQEAVKGLIRQVENRGVGLGPRHLRGLWLWGLWAEIGRKDSEGYIGEGHFKKQIHCSWRVNCTEHKIRDSCIQHSTQYVTHTHTHTHVGRDTEQLNVTQTSVRSGNSEQMDSIDIKRERGGRWTSTVINTSLVSGWGQRLDGGIELQRVEQVHERNFDVEQSTWKKIYAILKWSVNRWTADYAFSHSNLQKIYQY